jgi:hypothetical protein
MKLAETRPDVDFDAAFGAARAAGADQFDWRGKRYTTVRTDDPKQATAPIVTCMIDLTETEQP